MFRQSRMRPSKAHLFNDQLPFLSSSRFSALPQFRAVANEPENLSLFIAVLYVVDLFGILPFVTLPGLVAELGFFGIPLIVSVVILQIYTSFLLSKCWTMAEKIDPSIVQKSSFPYAAITDLAYGRHASFFVRVLLDLSIFATGIPNIVVASQNLELVGKRISEGNFFFSFCYWVLIVGTFLCPLVWIGSPKHMRGLVILSVCVVIVIIILLWFCLFAAEPIAAPFKDIPRNLPPFLKLLNGYSLLAFQFDIHPMLLTLQIDMEQKSQVYWAALSGIIITSSIAIFGSVIATYKFGSMISDNLLETLPRSVPLYFMLILMALQLCFSTAAGSSAMLLQIENFFHVPESLSIRRIVLRSSVVAFQVLIAEFVPAFDALMGVVGGTITGPLVFILPPLLFRRIKSMKRFHQRISTEAAYGSVAIDLNYEHIEAEVIPITSQQFLRSIWQRIVHAFQLMRCDLSVSILVLCFGVVATFCSTYLNLFQLSDLFKNSSTCFGNSMNVTSLD